MKVAKRLSLVGVVAALALFVGVTTASAGTVSWFGGCFQNGTATTTAGPVQVRFGWATDLPQRTQKFLDYQTITYTVNGASTTTPVGDETGWGPITQTVNGSGQTIYVSFWTSPVLANLSSGQSVTVSLSLTATKMIWDSDSVNFKAGTQLLGSVKSCTITAT